MTTIYPPQETGKAEPIMGTNNGKLAVDISDLIGRGELDSYQLSLIEVACRKERARLGPHRRTGEEPSGRKRKKLHRPTAEEISAELASRYSNSAGEVMNVDYPAPDVDADKPLLNHMVVEPSVPYTMYNGKYYPHFELRKAFIGKIFVTDTYPALRRLQCKVTKINRTRAVIEVEGKPRNYTIPIRSLINIYLNGEFQ